MPEAGIPIHKKIWEITFNSQIGCRNITEDIIEAQEKPDKMPDTLSAMTVNAGYPLKDYDWQFGISSSVVIYTETCEGMEEALRVLKKLIKKLRKKDFTNF